MRLREPLGSSRLVRPTLSSAMQQEHSDLLDRRGGNRRLFDYRLRLTPLEGDEPIAESVYVYGRDLSARGVGFEHPETLTHRKVRLVAADPKLDDLGFGDLEIDVVLRWCRFLGTGAYESGGRITRTTVPLF